MLQPLDCLSSRKPTSSSAPLCAQRRHDEPRALRGPVRSVVRGVAAGASALHQITGQASDLRLARCRCLRINLHCECASSFVLANAMSEPVCIRAQTSAPARSFQFLMAVCPPLAVSDLSAPHCSALVTICAHMERRGAISCGPGIDTRTCSSCLSRRSNIQHTALLQHGNFFLDHF